MSILQKSMAEFIGTFALVFFGCGSLMVLERFPGSFHPLGVPVVFGLVVLIMIYSVGHISGAHLNPAVTVAFGLSRHFPKKDILFYVVAQCLGSICAIGMLSLILPTGQIYGATVPQVPDVAGCVWEVILTFFLMFTIIAVATDTRAVGTLAGMAIGGAVALCAFVGGPVSGASMNPARSLGPALFEGRLDVLWIYILGPLLGAILAVFTYELIRCHKDAQPGVKGCC